MAIEFKMLCSRKRYGFAESEAWGFSESEIHCVIHPVTREKAQSIKEAIVYVAMWNNPEYGNSQWQYHLLDDHQRRQTQFSFSDFGK